MCAYATRVLTTRSVKNDITTYTLIRNGVPFSTSVVDTVDNESPRKFVGIGKLMRSSKALTVLGVSEESLKLPLSRQRGILSKLSNEDIVAPLCKLAEDCFSLINPNTGEKDLIAGGYYNHLVPLVVGLDIVPTQVDESNNLYFNPNGSLSRAEFIAMLGKLVYTSEKERVSIDGVSRPGDYFNKSYNSIVSTFSNPLFRFYTRRELVEPITRCELAYILVVCWKEFRHKLPLVGGRYRLGVNVDWSTPEVYKRNFMDADSLGIGIEYIDGCNVANIDIRDYRCNEKLGDYLGSMKENRVNLPLPYFMSMVELDVLGLFKYGGLLAPLREVSRGEVTYTLVELSKLLGSV